ncbi:COX ASSEMBLY MITOCHONDRIAL PROTEIN [Salix viminalis]|uniref:COX assembly mitochondrial protein n=1 Tax=Salix viminalis TaxID=40686 RepID=A0A9Q0TPV2_SALVM|nr:COX ASSEMBLY MITOCHONDRIAL PROTEIN [Salix viminalis]
MVKYVVGLGFEASSDKGEDGVKMHPPLTLHRHPMCVEIIEQFQKCHLDHPIAKFFGECTELKIKLDRCFREEKAVKRKVNFEQSKKHKERLQALRKEAVEASPKKSNFV